MLTVAKLREMFGLSQHDLALLLGRSQSKVSRMERGKSPSAADDDLLGQLERLAKQPKKRRPNLRRIIRNDGRIRALKCLCI